MKYKNYFSCTRGMGEEWPVSRLIFVDAAGGLGTATGGAPEGNETHEGNEAPSDETRAEIQRQRIAVDAARQGRELAREAPDVSGPPEKYLKLFEDKKNPQYQRLFSLLVSGIAHNDQGILCNVDRWANIEPPSQAAILFKLGGPMPVGPGYVAFVEGLDAGDANPEGAPYKRSLAVLYSIIAELKKDLDAHARESEDVAAHRDEPLLGYGMKELGDTFVRNWNESSGWKKAAIVVGGGAIVYWLWGHKDKKILPGMEFSYFDGAKLFGAACAVNLIWKQFNPKGQSLLGSLDVAPSVDDLKERKNQELALHLGMSENEKKLATWEKIAYMDVRELYRAYEPASRAGAAGTRMIPPESLGLAKDTIDPKSLYEIVDALVMETALNAGISKERLKNNHGDALTAFENKYLHGDIARTHPTVFTAFFLEFRTKDFGQIVERHRRQETPQQIVDTVGQWGTDAGNFVVRQYEDFTNWTSGKWESFKGSVLSPAGRYAQHYFSRISPYAVEIFGETVTYYKVTDVDDVMPSEWALQGEPPDKIRVLGVPGVEYSIYKLKSGDTEITIDGVVFSKDGALGAANEDERDELKGKMQQRVKDAVKAKAGTSVAALTNGTPEWDTVKKEWVIRSVTIAGSPLLHAATRSSDVSVRLDGAAGAKFFVNGKEVADITKLSETYDAAKVEEAIKAVAGYEMLHGLPVSIQAAQDLGGGKTRILGKIAGLDFDAVADTGTLGNFQFQDATGRGGMEKLFVGENNGGLEFLDRKAAQILTSPQFIKPFFELQDLIDSTGESIWARTSDLFANRALWIIPTNFSGAINGKVLQEQWKYMLDFKKSEALGVFQSLALNTTGNNLQNAYDGTIKKTVEEATRLASDIRMLANDEQRATMFADHMARLENLNYTNPEIQQLFGEYQRMLREYDYAGLESLTDVNFASKEAHEIYQVLLYVWSSATASYANQPIGGISPAARSSIQSGVIEKVRGVLDAAKQAGGGTIKLENLPPFDTPEQRARWLDPSLISTSRSPWAVGH